MKNPKLANNIKLYFIAEFFAELIFIIPIFIAFQKQYITFSQMSMLAASRYAITLILELPTGAIADLLGRKISAAFGFMLETIGLAYIALYPSAQSIIIGTLIRAIGESFISGAATALFYDTLKELGRESEFSRLKSYQVLIVQWSIVIGTLLGGYLYTIWQGLPYALFALGNLISAALYLAMQEPHIDSIKFTLSSYIEQTKQGFKQLTTTTYHRNLSLYYALVGGITWSWQIYFNLVYLSSLGFSEVTQGWILALVRIINSFIIVRLLHIDRLITKKRVFLFFPLLMIVTIVLMGIPNQVVSVLLIFGLMIASTLRFILLDRYTNEVFESRYRASALSALNMLIGIVYVFFVALSGFILDRFPITYIYYFSGIVVLLLIFPQAIRLTKRI